MNPRLICVRILKGLLESLQDARIREAARLIKRHQNLIDEGAETVSQVGCVKAPPLFPSGNPRAAGD